MQGEFERALEECLQALSEGTADIEACLRRYPIHAERLLPHLQAAYKLVSAFAAEAPSDEFAERARQRFLVASGQRLREAFEVDPTPGFFAAARVRFLMAAQAAFGARRREHAARARRLPVFGSAYRAAGAAAAAIALLAGASGYTVAEASDALPGDRLYGLKLQTERVRLALAFTDDAERDVRLDIAQERIEEIEELAEEGRIIGPGVIERLQDETKTLAEDLEDLDVDDLERVSEITADSQAALARARPQVAAEAKPILEEAQAFVQDVKREADVLLVNRKPAPVITPSVLLATPEPSKTPEPTATPESSSTPQQEPEFSPTPAREGLVVGPTPAGVDIGVTWIRIAVGRFSTLVPSPQDGWSIAGVDPAQGTAAAPALVRIINVDGTQIIAMNPRNGDLYWFVRVGGLFDEVQLRNERDGEIYVVDRDLLRRLYGPLADVPLYVLDHIEIAPEPTPVPSATPTTTPTEIIAQ
jgi:hypothetical protein